MAGHWSVAQTVPDTLLFLLGNTSRRALQLLDAAAQKLDPRARRMRALRTRRFAGRIRDSAAPSALDDAGHAVDLLGDALAAVGGVFDLCCADLSVHDKSVEHLNQRWRHHLADAFLHTDEAWRRIRCAKDNFAESGEAYRTADEVRVLRHDSQRGVVVGKKIARRDCLEASGAAEEVWMIDAFCRARYALWIIDDAKADIAEADEIAHAADHVRSLRRALVRLFFDAWKVCV